MARRSRRLPALLAALALVVVAALVVIGVSVTGDDDPGSSTGAVPPATGPGLDLEPPPTAPPVLAAVPPRPAVSVARLRAHLAGELAQPALGGLGFGVAQLGSTRTLWASGSDAVTPASTMKLLTTEAALATMGGRHRFTTSVVRGGQPGSIVLVGGGDPLLASGIDLDADADADQAYPQPASLQRLAVAVATKLAAEGVRRVRLGYDDSLFTGPAVNPHWPSTYVADDVVSPISALWVNEGRDEPGLARRSSEPAQYAADLFRVELGKAGLRVTGPVLRQVAPPAPHRVVAAVSSPPLDAIVTHVLEVSDNEGAEVLLRQVAIAAGKPGSSVAGVAMVRRALQGLGLDLQGAVFYDGSGLSRDDNLPVQLLLHVLETAASPAHPGLRSVITGLPVAGFSGSLGDRFTGDASAGLGYVRAKTGTLTGVDGLAGLVTTRRGQVLVFVAVADEVPSEATLQARSDLDDIAAALADCAC